MRQSAINIVIKQINFLKIKNKAILDKVSNYEFFGNFYNIFVKINNNFLHI